MYTSRRRPRALTIIELAGTFAVMAVVAAISFVGLRSFVSYQDDETAKSLLATVRDLQGRYASLNDSFTTSPTDLVAVPSGITITSSASTDRGIVSMAVGSNGSLGLATLTSSGVCYTLRVPPLSGALAGAEQTEATLPTSANCEGRSALPPGEWALPAGAPSDTPMYLLSAAFSPGAQTLTNQGRAGTTLDAQVGSASTADSNDPVWLPYGGEVYAYLPGVAGNQLSTADSSGTSPSGSFEVRLRLAAASWTPATDQVLAAKWGAAGQRAWRLMLTSSGGLSLLVSSDGTSTTSTSTSSSAVPFGASQIGWVRAVYTASAGSYQVAFHSSADGYSWTALNTPTTNAVASSAVFDSSATTKLGGADDATLATFRGGVYSASFTTNAATWADFASTSCNQTTCAGSANLTWSVQRATAPLAQTAIVDRSMFLIGGGSWLQVPANAGLDLPAGKGATVVIAGRWHGGASSGTPQVVSRRDEVSNAVCGTGGWSIHQTAGSTPSFRTVLADGSSCISGVLTLGDHQTGVLGFVRSSDGSTVSSFAGRQLDDFATKAGTTNGLALKSYQSSYPLRVGLLGSGSGVAADQPGAFEFFGIAVYDRALTDEEIAAVARLLGS